MNKIDLKSLAKRQWQDYQQNNPGTFFSTEKNTLSIDEAYEVQKEYTKIRCTSGDEAIGYKVGCTGSKIIKQFGIAGPIYGRLFKNEIYISGIKLKKNNFKNLAVEAEMAVEIGEDLKIKKAFPVIELHNFIFRSKRKTLMELIVNNAFNAGLVLSDKKIAKPINQWDSAKHLILKVNDKIVEFGNPWAMKGGANESVKWLQKNLNLHGLSIKQSNIILTGTSLSLYHVNVGDFISVFVDKDELVNCKIE